MIRLFEPSMGLPLSRRFHLLELSDEVNQGLGLNRGPRAVPYVEFTQFYCS